MFVFWEKLLPLLKKTSRFQKGEHLCVCVLYLQEANPDAIPVHTRLGSLVGSRLWPHHMCNAYVDRLVGGHGHLVG